MSFTAEEKKFITLYKSEEYGQAHLFDEAIPIPVQKQIIADIQAIGAALPSVDGEDAVLSYIKRARVLLEESASGVSAYADAKIAVPTGVDLPVNLKNSDFLNYEAEGLKKIGKTGFVLVAGGLGERLGYDGIKLELPVDLVSMKTHLQWYIETILAYQQTSGAVIPLAIMTSDDTHKKTVELLEKNNYYGASADQITLIKQTKVFALSNNNASFALVRDRENKVVGIETKPHGHGDVHSLMKDVLPLWQETYGTEYVAFIQDTNSLVFNGIPLALGVSVSKGYVFNTIAVDRQPGEAVGALTRITKADGTSSTLNVEYNQLSAVLQASGLTEETDANGKSVYPGNTNVFIVEAKAYQAVLEATGGILGEFINPKYKEGSKTEFRSSARLESLMQDLPKALGSDALVGYTKLDRWFCFSAVKNSVKDAAAKVKAGLYPECALSAEADRYACYTQLLRLCVEHSNGKFYAEEPEEVSFFDVAYKVGPKVVIYPSFASSVTELLRRVAGATIELRSGEPKGNTALILSGNAQIHHISIEQGAFSVAGGPIGPEGARDAFLLHVTEENVDNKGWFLEPTIGSFATAHRLPPYLRIRGYTLHKAESRVLHASFDELATLEARKKQNQKCCF